MVHDGRKIGKDDCRSLCSFVEQNKICHEKKCKSPWLLCKGCVRLMAKIPEIGDGKAWAFGTNSFSLSIYRQGLCRSCNDCEPHLDLPFVRKQILAADPRPKVETPALANDGIGQEVEEIMADEDLIMEEEGVVATEEVEEVEIISEEDNVVVAHEISTAEARPDSGTFISTDSIRTTPDQDAVLSTANLENTMELVRLGDTLPAIKVVKNDDFYNPTGLEGAYYWLVARHLGFAKMQVRIFNDLASAEATEDDTPVAEPVVPDKTALKAFAPPTDLPEKKVPEKSVKFMCDRNRLTVRAGLQIPALSDYSLRLQGRTVSNSSHRVPLKVVRNNGGYEIATVESFLQWLAYVFAGVDKIWVELVKPEDILPVTIKQVLPVTFEKISIELVKPEEIPAVATAQVLPIAVATPVAEKPATDKVPIDTNFIAIARRSDDYQLALILRELKQERAITEEYLDIMFNKKAGWAKKHLLENLNPELLILLSRETPPAKRMFFTAAAELNEVPCPKRQKRLWNKIVKQGISSIKVHAYLVDRKAI